MPGIEWMSPSLREDDLFMALRRHEVITGEFRYPYPFLYAPSFPPSFLYGEDATLERLKQSYFLLANGLPRKTATPISMTSLYNRQPYLNWGQYQTQ